MYRYILNADKQLSGDIDSAAKTANMKSEEFILHALKQYLALTSPHTIDQEAFETGYKQMGQINLDISEGKQ